METLLKNADAAGYSSLAFPAMGTGQLKFPKNMAAKIMFEATKAFANSGNAKNLKDVIFVLYDKDKECITVCYLVYLFIRAFRNIHSLSQSTWPIEH